ncbi:hypothetical protein Pcinc_001906 [Petrolisthes cinctipes]|uniref:Uncharacterized protein n=1 Tax=Petrolisthes cinctipes TaxID=88211 RepID=A0AAE1GKQ9_PETCI|nr:hypothetical protein Pcinc_025380 [Petrolisthes cinctipes]KAK3894327.1 hypothetical protein Pcinc_001906 [Petrolisthes cinctipes]
MWYILCICNLPHRPISQPEPGTYNIVSVHHESVSAVFMSVLKNIIMVLYRNTITPLFISTLYCTGKSCRIYPVLKAAEGGLSVPTPKAQRAGGLGKTVYSVIPSKPNMGRHPHEGQDKRGIVGSCELTQYVLHDTATAGPQR